MTSAALSNPVSLNAVWLGMIGTLLLLWAGAVGWVGWHLRRLYQQAEAPQQAAAQVSAHGIRDQATAIDSLRLNVAPQVARLLSNPLTTHPYTVALSGGWGAGKSSVMEQIKEELHRRQFAFQAIDINIWHFQQEDQLLTWFLSQILDKCNTWHFRWRQMLHRLRTLGFARTLYRTLVLALAFPVLLYALVALAHGFGQALNPATGLYRGLQWVHHAAATRWLARLFAPAFYVIGHLDNALRTTGQTPEPRSSWRVLVPELSVVFTFFALLTSVGASLSKLPELIRPLVELIPYQQKYEVAQGPAGLRQRYQQDFRTIIQNARRQRLVIFVDDIDRVSGPMVLGLLEALNFIVNSASATDGDAPKGGAVYFVLAMNVPEVIRRLAPVLDAHQQLPTAEAREQLAASYLAKLIDLTVRIPTLHDREVKSLFTS